MDLGAAPTELNLDADGVRSLILSYLIHHCYIETAHAFMQACGLEEQWKAQSVGIQERKYVLELVREGNIPEAIATVNKVFPDVLTRHPEVYFKLLCQQFIELIRKGDNQTALVFAQKELNTYAKKRASFLESLQEIFPLIAYAEPATSPLGIYLTEEYKEKVIGQLNSAILEKLNMPNEAAIDTIVRQLTVVHGLLNADKPNEKKWTLNRFLHAEGKRN